MAAIITGVTTGVNAGVDTGVNPSGGALADSDATSGKYVPSTAAQFTALGISAPASIHLCQEASGNLADSVGSMTLTAHGSPTYQQAVAGWSRKAVGLTQAANQRFAAAGGVGPDPSSTSVLMLIYASVTTPAGNRDFFGPNITGASFIKAQVTATPLLRINVTGTTTNGASNPTSAGVQPLLLKYDRTGGAAVLYTGQEKIVGTYSAAVADGNKGFGSSGATSALALILYGAVWSGAAAEVSDAQAKALLQALNWSIPWS